MSVRAVRLLGAASAFAIAAAALPARAEVSPQDGFAPDGSYQVHVEIDPYLWLPATRGTLTLGNGAQASISAGIPSVNDLTSHLHGALFGFGLVRYGPWSAELNFNWLSASGSKEIAPDLSGGSRFVGVASTLVRVGPGIGYEIVSGSLYGVPTIVDARVGFSYFSTNDTITLTRAGALGVTRQASVTASPSFTQPWLGIRISAYPWPRWRLQLGAAGVGFGVGGGTWGWQVAATATWAANDWLNVIGGLYADHESANTDQNKAIRAVDFTLFGPVVGIGITF